MNFGAMVRKALGYFLMSMGISSPNKKPAAPRPEAGKPH
jgi:hypothetical protein